MFAMLRWRLLISISVLLIGLRVVLPGSIGHAQVEQPTATGTPGVTLSPAPASIQSPAAGQALQGRVIIQGNTAVAGFISSELNFAYSDSPLDTQFLINATDKPVSNGNLAEWDTSTITDGVYDLHLTVALENGNSVTVTIPKLRVRNYTTIETNTPTPVTPTATTVPGDTPIPSATPTPTQTPIPPTATALAANPVEITDQDVNLSLGKGALLSLGLFALIGVYVSIKNLRKRN
jgi:hypothetical protein